MPPIHGQTISQSSDSGTLGCPEILLQSVVILATDYVLGALHRLKQWGCWLPLSVTALIVALPLAPVQQPLSLQPAFSTQPSIYPFRQGAICQPLKGHPLDFNQFIPRGHLTFTKHCPEPSHQATSTPCTAPSYVLGIEKNEGERVQKEIAG